MTSPPPKAPEQTKTKTTKAHTFHHRGPHRQTLLPTSTHPFPPFPPQPPLPKTAPHPEQWLLLRVSHAALNPGDLVALSVMPFLIRSHRHTNPAAVPCLDFTGTVVEIWDPDTSSSTADGGGGGGGMAQQEGSEDGDGGGVKFTEGDAVVCFVTFAHALATGVGGLQGVVAIPARYAVKVPEGRTLREAAGLLVTGCTADMRVAQCGVGEGQRVLVVGASGGVGTMVMQMVREKVGGEGRVVAVCSGRNEALVRGLGADEVIDYTQYPDLPGELARRFGEQPFDNIIDAYGKQEVYKACARYLKPEGMYNAASVHYDNYTTWDLLKSGLTLAANAIWPRSPWLGGTGRTWQAASMMDPGREMMERVVGLFGEGKLRVVVDSEWPFDKVHEGFDVLKGGHAAGKVIIKVNEE